MNDAPLFVPSNAPAIDVERLMLDHKIVSAYVEPGTEDDVIVVCKCRRRFDLGESHTLHVFGVLRDSSTSTTALTNTVRELGRTSAITRKGTSCPDQSPALRSQLSRSPRSQAAP